MDIDPYRFNNIEKTGIALYKVNLDYPSFSDIKEKFDIIYFSHVFEHLRINLIISMKFLKNILKSDGIIYVETPNSYSLIGWYNKLFRGISTGCSNDLFHECFCFVT